MLQDSQRLERLFAAPAGERSGCGLTPLFDVSDSAVSHPHPTDAGLDVTGGLADA